MLDSEEVFGRTCGLYFTLNRGIIFLLETLNTLTSPLMSQTIYAATQTQT